MKQNTDTISHTTFAPNATDATAITVANGSRFRAGDAVRPNGAREVLLVLDVIGNVLALGFSSARPRGLSEVCAGVFETRRRKAV